MSYLPHSSDTVVLDAILTRKGRELIARNDQSFKIRKYGFADDDINYKLMTSPNIDEDDPQIMSLPIAEPSSNESMEMIHKIWVNQTFLNEQFSNFEQSNGQYVLISTQVGNQALIYSNDTTTKLRAWVASYNTIDRPYVADFYRFKFTSDIDFFSIQFESPLFSDTVQNNFTKISNSEYIFNAVNSDGSGRYERTDFGAPTVVFSIRFIETPQFYDVLAQPQNKDSILVPDFLTVTQIDSARNPVSDVKVGSLSLLIKNSR